MKSFDSLIGSAVRAAVRDDRRIRRTVSRIVPAEALAHVRFCRVAERQLRVTLDSAAWIPRLRFEERRLLAALARDGHEVRTVRWHVSPLEAPDASAERHRARAGTGVGKPDRRGPKPSAGTPERVSGDARGTRRETGRPEERSVAATVGDDPLARQLRRMERHLRARAIGDDEPD